MWGDDDDDFYFGLILLLGGKEVFDERNPFDSGNAVRYQGLPV